MKQHRFEQAHEAQWQQLERWLQASAKSSQADAGFDAQTAQFPHHYRQVCQHLALARDRHYTSGLQERLNRLVLQGHQRLYRAPRHFWHSLVAFLSHGFPQSVRREWRVVLLAGVLFYAPLFGLLVAVQIQPSLVYSIMSESQVSNMETMYDPSAERLGTDRQADSDLMMFGFYIYNNISIGFKTFATGILWGLGSVFFLLLNGIYIGAIAGHLTHIGYSVPFYSFVSGHSGLELTGIMLAGAAGLKLGYALIAPKRLSRLQALRQAALCSLDLVYGVIVLLSLAAVVEAFWSSNSSIAPVIKYTVGMIVGLLVLAYLLLAGRSNKPQGSMKYSNG